MSKNRFINTKFWDDSFIEKLEPLDKLIFLYLLTCTSTTLSGVYEISLKRISFDTKIKETTIRKAFEGFQTVEKIYYFDGWVIIRNFIKNQNLNDNMRKSVQKELGELPDNIAKFICENETLRKAFEPFGILSNPSVFNIHLIKSNLIQSTLNSHSMNEGESKDLSTNGDDGGDNRKSDTFLDHGFESIKETLKSKNK
jgi:hypothetical protein